MSEIQKDKNLNHYHTDPILIHQTNCKNDLMIGQFVYLDVDNNYYPSIATFKKTAVVHGVVWNFESNDSFYLKTEQGPLLYKFPLIPAWFPNIENIILVDAPLYSKIPGNLGCKLYLSDIIHGGVTNKAPTDGDLKCLIGYKTEYGILFRPEIYQ